MSATDYLEIDGLSLWIHECWQMEDVAPLLSGSDRDSPSRKIPGAAGDETYGQVTEPTKVNLKVTVMGLKNWLGVEYADSRRGLGVNVAKLQAEIVGLVTTGDATRTATLHMADLAVPPTKPVQIIGPLDLSGYGPHAARGTLRLSFPRGLFDLSGWLV